LKFLLFFFLSSFTIFTDFYFMVPALTFANFSLLIIICLTFLHKDVLWKSINLSSNEQLSIIKIAFVFIIYIFIINLFNGIGLTYSIKTILIQSACVLCLPLFNYFYYKEKFNFINWLYFFIFIHFIFVLFQSFGTSIVPRDLMPQNILIGVAESKNDGGFVKTTRATGATSSPILLAQQALAFLVITFVAFSKNVNLKNLLFFIFSITLLISTQSRAAIFSFIPLMIMCNLLYKDFTIRKVISFSILIAAIIFITIINLPNLEIYFPYTFKIIDQGDTNRFYTNLYLSKGVLLESPIFGVAPEVAWQIFEKYADANYMPFLLEDQRKVPTHHNQLFYFLRYYGLIGVALLFALYFKIFKAIRLVEDRNMAYLVGAIFVLDLFFSMTHNNKIFSPLLWIYLSLIFMPLKKEE